jgi:hypothetical protein
MAKEKKTAVEIALDMAQELRLRIVKCRFDRYEETAMLDKCRDIIASIERAAKPKDKEEGGADDGK